MAKTETDRVPWLVGLRMRCPYCHEGNLFDGFLSLPKQCPQCEHSFDAIDSGDGPAFFVMVLVSVLVVIPAIVVELKFAPPPWIFPVVFAPLTLLLSLAFLRPLKGLMICLQVHFKAQEGTSDEG